MTKSAMTLGFRDLEEFVKELTIYTDGGCLPNKRGAWAYVVSFGGDVLREDSGFARKVDSLRMELMAAVRALESLTEASDVSLFTDSSILVDIASRDLALWSSLGWKRASGRDVLNLDLLRRLQTQLTKHRVHFKWVKAHSLNPLNERCDQLCRAAYSQI